MLVVGGIAVAGGVAVLQRHARRAPGIREGVSAVSYEHEGVLLEARGVRAETSVAEVAELIRAIDEIIPVTQFAGFGFDATAHGTNVARAGLRKLRGGFRGDRLLVGVARKEINVQQMLRNQRARGVNAGEPVVVVVYIE